MIMRGSHPHTYNFHLHKSYLSNGLERGGIARKNIQSAMATTWQHKPDIAESLRKLAISVQIPATKAQQNHRTAIKPQQKSLNNAHSNTTIQ